jgi:hypothetical protein
MGVGSVWGSGRKLRARIIDGKRALFPPGLRHAESRLEGCWIYVPAVLDRLLS